MNFVHEATRLAELGFHVFPCANPLTDKSDVGKKGKRPLVARGCKDATLDFDKIESWGNLYPNANIGITCTNCFVLDVDDKDGKSGSSDLQMLIDRFGPLPDGPVAKSGSGGLHLFFALPAGELSAKTGIPFEGRKLSIDIRTGNSYVVAAPSLHECGQCYEWIKPLVPVEELPELPEGWRNVVVGECRVESGKLKVESGAGESGKLKVESLDNSTFNSKLSTLERAISYLAKCSPAIQGSGGHSDLLWAATALIHGFGLSDIETESLLTDHYNPRCVPPWDLSNATDFKEFVRKIEQARKFTPSKPYLWLLNESPIEEHSGVDISGIIGVTGDNRRIESPTIITEPKVSKPMTIPDRLLHIPGFIEQVVDFSLKAAPIPNPTMALLGAIACQSLLVARKVRSADAFRPSIYLLGLAGTGSGKDYPRAVNQYILDEVGLGEHIPETCASGEGLEDAIVSKGTLLLQTDEINFTFSSMASGKESRFASLEAIILKLYSSSHKVYTGRLKANHIGKAQTLAKVYEPGLTIFGTSTPQRFYRALTLDMIEGGLASRCLVVEGENRGKSKRQLELSTMPSEILDIANHWATYSPKGSGDLNGINSRPTLAEIALTPQAVEKMESFRQYCDDRNIALAGNNKFVEAALWTRVYENAGRLALIHACSKNHLSPVIDEQATRWAGEFSKWTVEQTIRSVSQNLSDNKFHGECQKIKKIIRDNGGSMNHSKLMKKAHMSKKVIKEIVETLLEAGTLGFNSVETNTKAGLEYQLFDED